MDTDTRLRQDAEHLKLLSIFHYIVGGLMAAYACIPLVHVTIGLAMVLAPETMDADDAPAFIGWFFVILGGSFVILGWTIAACVIAAGRCLTRRRRYIFCFVVAAIQCLFTPFGTVLGVFTIIVLVRESVKASFCAAVPEMLESQ